MSVEKKFTHKFSLEDTNVFVDLSVMEAFRAAIQLDEDTEHFGVIIGSKSEETDTYWIEALTEPRDNDEATITSFTLKDPEHQSIVDHKFEASRGELGYLGTWHTHPESFPVPSRIDRQDWKKCVRNNGDRRLFFFIIGRSEIRLFTLLKRKFIQMEMTDIREASDHV